MPNQSSPQGGERPSESLSSSGPSRAHSPSVRATRSSESSPYGPQPEQNDPGGVPEVRPPSAPADPSAPLKSPPSTFSVGDDSRIQNADTHQCVSGDASVYPAYGTCSASEAYAWTFRSTGDGTFKLVNQASGNCLSAPYNNNYAAGLESCSGGPGGTGYVHWRVGQTKADGQTVKNTETGHCLAMGSPPYGGSKQVMVTTCNSDRPQQLWSP
ncbi:RICIN domain-containing protein [Streptomyces sp. 7N604]|uniref:RICIN domain-containing protein n=1 Tax=Streptomyces sp. 7N604 TaxID=3457415 RepID=UPI003FD2983C